ncbi:MAG TPA: hypothetical protein VH040_08345 [Usitatibacter sp.]|jgi:hypothetical protein|nr:hypothetical protein [Usitatibacter sp.]
MSEPGQDPAKSPWSSPAGEVISCVEKLKVLRENLDEIRTLCQDAIDDAVLMGCDETQFRDALVQLAASMESAYKGLPEK